LGHVEKKISIKQQTTEPHAGSLKKKSSKKSLLADHEY